MSSKTAWQYLRASTASAHAELEAAPINRRLFADDFSAAELGELLGRFGFSSVVDEGSRFWLDFPLCDDKVEPPAVATEGGRKLHYCFEDRLVLYIEDNVFNMRLMEALFEQLAPMRLITANNAEDGLTLARSSQPDAILLDINLPGINGFEAVARLKHDALIRHIPVVGLSADATSATAERALNSGFVDYLTKPVNLSELIRTLSRVMEAKFVTYE